MIIENDDLKLQLYNYSYSQLTGKLSLSDGTEDSFCRFFNEEDLLKEDLILRDDARKKRTIKMVLDDIKRDDRLGLTSNEIWNLQYERYDCFRDCVRIGDFWAERLACLSNPNEFQTVNDFSDSDYTYCNDKQYGEEENGISLIPGKKFMLYGLEVEIEENGVDIRDSQGRDITTNGEVYFLKDILDKLIRVANDQYVASKLRLGNMETAVLQIIRDLGINTKNNFIINEREFVIKENKIFAVDELNNPLSYLGLTKKQLDIAIEKYENNLLCEYKC